MQKNNETIEIKPNKVKEFIINYRLLVQSTLIVILMGLMLYIGAYLACQNSGLLINLKALQCYLPYPLN